ncbi:MAG: M14 metallopeptidase family protein [Pyrinomonadaceae bacterium]
MNISGIQRKSDELNLFLVCSATLRLCGLIFLLALVASSQIPSPKSVLGFTPTDDKTIADWGQITDYFAKLDKASNKVAVKEIGKTTNGKPLILAFISSPNNIKNLEKYRQISAKLADPRAVKNDTELADLIKNGKTIVSISCSIHSTEIVASQMSMNLAYELATAIDSDTKEILDNTILLLIPSPNPDGVDIVADWYRKTLGTKSEGTSPPELYHHYAGHDDNRDWFMLNLVETRAVTKLFWQQWFPQIVYDVHQQGQNASRFIIPPFFDPPNPRVAPSILREVGLIGYKMAADLQAKNIAGVATNSTYDTWWHGGFRSAPYFHNSIGILSEAASANLMSPINVTVDDLKRNRGVRGLPSVLETATNFPDAWKGGLWRPADINEIEMTASRALLSMAAKYRPRYLRNFYEYGKANLAPRSDEPQAFIVSAGQPNTETVSRFFEILMAQGIEVYQMTRELYVKMQPVQAQFHEMPLGSFLIFVNQPQKNNVLSLFERQEYPHRLLPNGDAEVPYDVAGWTLPMQMGVDYETAWQINEIDKERAALKKVENIDQVRSVINLAPSGGPFAKKPNPLKTNPKIGLYKGFTGSMDEGWTRLVLDAYQIPYRSVSDGDMRSGSLDLDAIILPADGENTIVNGLSAERYPAEFVGGIGEAGVANLKKFVENGGKLICFDDSCEMVIKRFNLPIKNVLGGLKRSEFYNPGSVVQLDVDTRNNLAKGLKQETAAYFTSSSAFEVVQSAGKDASERDRSRTLDVVARYAAKNALLSGWMLGEKYINSKAALIETTYGKGKIVLFAFRPQHRGQSWGTFPFIFNAMER